MTPVSCAQCGAPFGARGGSPICRKCSIAADVTIAGMVAQGHTSKAIATAAKLSEASVTHRRWRLKLTAPMKPKKIVMVERLPAPVILIGIASQPVAKPAKTCPWPSRTDGGRDMHICCQTAQELTCDVDAA